MAQLLKELAERANGDETRTMGGFAPWHSPGSYCSDAVKIDLAHQRFLDLWLRFRETVYLLKQTSPASPALAALAVGEFVHSVAVR